MKNKICLVTGANSGIGKVTTRELYRQGAQVIMVCRNQEKALQVKMDLEAQYPKTGGKLDIVLGDLSRQDEVVKIARDVRQRYRHLDVLINNAGLVVQEKQMTEDGIEYTFAVNHLAPFLLTSLLLDLLRQSDEPRIINLSSEAHRMARFQVSQLANPKKYNVMRAYGNSKLCNILFTRQLAQRLQPEGITVNSVHPGFVNSNFGAGFSGIYKVIMTLSAPFSISSEAGAQTSLYLATSPNVKGITGKYFVEKKVRKPSEAALSDYYADQLWQLSEQLTQPDAKLRHLKEREAQPLAE
ncbi:NAD(P)-dependent dehydrogenase, short-chain alcohol dehydrogenase family [Catalinimonas alkaloidigena]|uniref:NAD(P)-dependent dehydrogenase, short-chain alcohol dehydrogenase family n=1 Tax=Catalinimonas alkaloidigena TaxID=1075417 RepID=A0A1G8X8U4_9BACT|nr:SDR family oxidoreductase [Catalinimonas alkaloidigena]SDJ86736.1 NAD(P)-dependent dehydrogenase, short-chain alcohol dehydrogenase family [Catalinimonas alkaloidigena]